MPRLGGLEGLSVAEISLCMIVKDEEQTIARCLQSVRHLVDEIVIVDTGSRDNTKSVCRRFTDRLFEFDWVDDFSAARNYAFSHATRDFILWLDADDVLGEEDQRKFQQLKHTLTDDVDAVTMQYHLTFDDNDKPRHTLRRHRIVKRSNNFHWFGAVHEYLEVRGNIVHSDVAVQHRPVARDPDRNIKIYESMLAQGKPFTPRDMYYYANELKDHGRLDEAISYYERFVTSGRGWIEDVIAACNKQSDCWSRLGKDDRALEAALRSMQFDYPRAEACCRVGHVYFNRHDYRTAAFWYSAAVAGVNVKPDQVPMFQNPAWSTWVPHLQLCVCYYRIGSYLLAYAHNEQAAKHIPDDEAVLRNRALLEPLAAREKEALQEKMAGQFPEAIQRQDAPVQAVNVGTKKTRRRRKR